MRPFGPTTTDGGTGARAGILGTCGPGLKSLRFDAH